MMKIQSGILNWRSLFSLRGAPVLACSFAMAFVIPLLLVWQLQRREIPPNVYFQDLETHSRKLEVTGQRLVFQGTESLNPPADKDFIVFSSWKLSHPLAPGERTVLVSKTRAANRAASNRADSTRPDQSAADGFALGIINDQGTHRFMIAWPGPDGSRWMRVGDVSLVAGDWFLVALSVRNQENVGVFFVPLKGTAKKPKVTVLGGVTVSGYAGDSAAPFSIAPQGAGRFMSRVGPSGVFRGADLGGREVEILSQLAEEPSEPPPALNRNQIVLFWSGGDSAIGADEKTRFVVSRAG